jgi:hypothetical protein
VCKALSFKCVNLLNDVLLNGNDNATQEQSLCLNGGFLYGPTYHAEPFQSPNCFSVVVSASHSRDRHVNQ